MKTFTQPQSAIDLATRLHYQQVYTVTGPMASPPHDAQEALRARHHAVIAKVAALLPVNANDPDLAAPRIAAQAEEMAAPSVSGRRHRLADAAERALPIDGTDADFRAPAPTAGAGIAPQAGGDRR